MRLLLGTDGQEVPFCLTDAAGNRLTSLALADIDVTVWKPTFAGFGRTANEHPAREIGFGWYVYAAGAADVDVEAPLVLRAVHDSAVPCEVVLDVVPAEPSVPATARPIGREGF